MKLILNVSVLRGPKTGIGHYTLALARSLARIRKIEAFYFDGLSIRENLAEMGSTGQRREAEVIRKFIPGAYKLRRMIMQQRFTSLCKKIKPDLYHEPSLWPLNGKPPSVMTLHDLTHIHYPETQPRNRLEAIERYCEIGLKRAGSILVDSAFIRDEAIEHYRLPPEKIVVAPLGVSDHFRMRPKQEVAPFVRTLGLQYGKYILSIGTLEPRKNLSFTLKAHHRLPRALRKEYPLVLVGAEGWNRLQFAADLESGISEGSVRMMGYVNDKKLALIANGGRMLVFPSIYEGFGLPVVEAMASGLPVVTSTRASLPEVAGPAAVYVDLDDEPGYTRQLVRLIEDEETWIKCRDKGLKQASRFTWQRCAEKTMNAYRTALQ